jgi:hypothetical protein
MKSRSAPLVRTEGRELELLAFGRSCTHSDQHPKKIEHLLSLFTFEWKFIIGINYFSTGFYLYSVFFWGVGRLLRGRTLAAFAEFKNQTCEVSPQRNVYLKTPWNCWTNCCVGGFLVVQKNVTTCYNFPVESDLRVPALAMQSGLDMVATHVANFGYFAINSWHVIVSYMMLHGLYIMICGYDCDLQQVLNKLFGSFWITILGDL